MALVNALVQRKSRHRKWRSCCRSTLSVALNGLFWWRTVLPFARVSDFNALHSRKHDHEVQLYALDLLVMAGDDLRSLPLHMRKANLEQLLARRPDGITVAPFERGEIGPDLFRAAAAWASRAWFQSTAIDLTAVADRSTGSR